MRCERCQGVGWLVHMRPHPGTVGHELVPFTQVCPSCKGKMFMTVIVFDGRAAAAGDLPDDGPSVARDFPGWAGA
jgi:hypothetical protein